ncbi:chloride channel protein, partial [Bacteroidota bacterium]
DYRKTTLLIACASAGAMSAIFKAPIAAIIFALEVLMLDLTLSALVPLLMASVTAAITSYLFLGQGVLYPFDVNESFHLSDIIYYVFFGILCGLISLYFTRVYFMMERFFYNMKSWYRRLLVGVFILGLLIFFIPALYGEGYSVINSALHGDYSYLFNNSLFYFLRENTYAILGGFIVLISLKVIATTATFGAGGIGGIFAPTLFVGANTGLMYAYSVNLLKIGSISESNFALTGMAGMIAGVIHAPLTAIFLIAEITGGYELFVPLMITATLSYATIHYFEKNSVYTRQLARRGELFTHDKDMIVLRLMRVENLLETKFITVHPDATLGDLVKVIPESKRNIFPVVDEDNYLHGIIHLNNIRNVMFDTTMYETTYVRNLMYFPVNVVSPDDSMETIVKKIQESGHYNVPVLKDGKYIGFVSRANVFSKYRKMLKEFSAD